MQTIMWDAIRAVLKLPPENEGAPEPMTVNDDHDVSCQNGGRISQEDEAADEGGAAVPKANVKEKVARRSYRSSA